MKALFSALLVGSGGFFGSAARYVVSGLVHRLLPGALFPWGTLTVNVLGCFAIGLLFGLGEARQLFSPNTRLFLMVGVLGGFTTFSTFGLESFHLMRDGEFVRAAAYVIFHLVIGLLAVWAGIISTR